MRVGRKGGAVGGGVLRLSLGSSGVLQIHFQIAFGVLNSSHESGPLWKR